jgi:hypothetical protein
MFLAVRRAGDCKDGNDREPNVTDKLGSIARRLRGGTALELYARCVRDLVKANVHGPRLETGLTISKVVLPGSLEAIVKSQRLDGRPRSLKAPLPLSERARIALAKELARNKPQSRSRNLALYNLRCWQHAAREDVFLNEVRPPAIILEPIFIDCDEPYSYESN